MTQSIGTARIDVVTDDGQIKRLGTKGGGFFGTAFAVAAGALIAKGIGKALRAIPELANLGEQAATDSARIDQIAQSMGRTVAESDTLTRSLVNQAAAYAGQTGVQATTIRQGQAILLTFKEVGKSAGQVGGTFDRATKAAADLAAAGFGELVSNSTSLGIALNDPAVGLTRLTRVGVTFTEQEKEQIKALTEAGKIQEAQNLLLGAIETQVAGTAEATANATDKMKVGWEAVGESVGQRLLPYLDRLAEFATGTVFPALIDVSTRFFDALENGEGIIGAVFDAFGKGADGIGGIDFAGLFEGLVEAGQKAFDALIKWLTTGGIAKLVSGILSRRVQLLEAAVQLFQALIQAVITAVPQILSAITDTLLPALVNLLTTAVPALLDAAKTLFLSLVQGIIDVLPDIIDALLDTIDALLDVLDELLPDLVDAAVTLFLGLVDGLVKILPDLIQTLVGEVIPRLIETLVGQLPNLIQAAVDLFLGLVLGLVEILPDLIKTLLTDVLPAVIIALTNALPDIIDAGLELFFGLIDALIELIPDLVETIIFDVIPAVVKAIIDAGPKMIEAGRRLIIGLGKGIIEAGKNLIKTIKDKIVGAIVDLWPFSPAKTGPFRTHPPDKAGENIMRLFGEGIARGARDVLGGISVANAGVSGGLSLAGVGPIQLSVTVNGDVSRSSAVATGQALAEGVIDRLSRARTVA